MSKRKWPEKIHVKVSQGDIATGVPRNGDECPIANALWASGMRIDYVCVEEISVDFNGGEMVYTLPKIAQDFVERFDNNAAVEPFEFDMIREGAQHEI